MREVARVKGIALKNFTWSLEHIYGPESVTRVLERLPEELADGLRYGRIVAVRVHIIGGGSEDDDWIEIEGHWL